MNEIAKRSEEQWESESVEINMCVKRRRDAKLIKRCKTHENRKYIKRRIILNFNVETSWFLRDHSEI